MCAYVYMIISALRGQSCPIPLELELQSVVSRRTWVQGLQLKSQQGQCKLLTTEPSSPYIIILITLSPAIFCLPSLSIPASPFQSFSPDSWLSVLFYSPFGLAKAACVSLRVKLSIRALWDHQRVHNYRQWFPLSLNLSAANDPTTRSALWPSFPSVPGCWRAHSYANSAQAPKAAVSLGTQWLYPVQKIAFLSLSSCLLALIFFLTPLLQSSLSHRGDGTYVVFRTDHPSVIYSQHLWGHESASITLH